MSQNNLEEIVERLLEWYESDEVKTSNLVAVTHGFSVTPEFAEKARDIWSDAYEALNKKPAPPTGSMTIEELEDLIDKSQENG